MVASSVPDIGEVMLKFVFGLILISLFWPVWLGIERLWFFSKVGQSPQPILIDLTKQKELPEKGYLKVTGYPGVQIAIDSEGPVYMENLAEASKTYKSFYFSLHSKPSSPAQVIVERKESFIGRFGFFGKSIQEKFPPPPEKNKLFTAQGIAGYYTPRINDDIRDGFKAGGITIADKAVLLREGTPPSVKLTLLWFVPILILFILGIYLLINALYWIPKVVL